MHIIYYFPRLVDIKLITNVFCLPVVNPIDLGLGLWMGFLLGFRIEPPSRKLLLSVGACICRMDLNAISFSSPHTHAHAHEQMCIYINTYRFSHFQLKCGDFCLCLN